MEVRATAKYVRVQPRKVRIIADEIRGKNCGHAAALLHHHTSKGARSLRKVLISAMANAAENHGLAPETLKIATIMVDEETFFDGTCHGAKSAAYFLLRGLRPLW